MVTRLLAPAPLCYPRRVRSSIFALSAVGSFLAMLTMASPAFAEPSAWVFVGGGALGWKQGDASTQTAKNDGSMAANGAMTIDVGIGTTPENRFIFGGLFRVQPIWQNGADFAFLARACTRGFQAGDFGVALDVGPYVRTWGPAHGGGLEGSLSLGLPLGFTVTGIVEAGSGKALAFGGVAGIDLARLSVFRRSLANWWQNPAPAWLSEKSASAGAVPSY